MSPAEAELSELCTSASEQDAAVIVAAQEEVVAQSVAAMTRQRPARTGEFDVFMSLLGLVSYFVLVPTGILGPRAQRGLLTPFEKQLSAPPVSYAVTEKK